ncbi:MAG: DUF4838 domain-containing protein [Lentisphaeria bacterium]|nr:DUF4838 domain-containing protein [Lentisphaeria bacterium]
MKKFISALFVLVLITSAAAQRVIGMENRPDRTINIGNKAIMTMTADNTVIVLPAKSSKILQFAAGELQYLLSGVLGKKVQISAVPVKGKNAIILGFNELSLVANFNRKQLVRDSYFIRSLPGRIFIAGTEDPKADPEKAINKGGVWSQMYERGVLFGVYDFAERFAGVRMYFPGELGTVMPRKKSIAIPPVDIYDRPDFVQRKVSTFWDGTYFEGKNPSATINPAKTLNSYRLRLETESIPCCHGTNGFQYVKRFGKTNPEYFALLANGNRHNDPSLNHSGQLCYSSGVIEEMYKDVRSYLKGEPASKRKIPAPRGKGYAWSFNTREGIYVDIMPQDSFSGCRCSKCQKAYKKGDTHYATELIWGYTVDFANRLKKEGIKGYLTQMAYRPYRRVPGFPIPDNVLVMVAESGPWVAADPQALEKENAEIKAWVKKLNRKVWVWNYVNKVATLQMPGIPQMSPNYCGKYYQDISPWIFGMFAESESDRFFFNYLNYYIISKVSWDNKTDIKKTLDEHYTLMFGKAAPVMKKYYERLEELWVLKVAGRRVDTPLGPMGSPPSDYDLWNKVYSPAELASMAADLKKAASMVPKNSLEARRIALVKRELYDHILVAAEKYKKNNMAVRGLKTYCSGTPGTAVELIPFRNPKKAALKTVKTQVQTWKTATDLHVKYTCFEPAMSTVAAINRNFDDPEIWKDNSVELFINPSADRKLYYQIIVNSEGSITDTKFNKFGTKAQHDTKWNSGTEAIVAKQNGSWTAELIIPLKNLPGLKDEFPVNFARNRIVQRGDGYETLYLWSPFAKGFHDLENFGSLSFKEDKNIVPNGNLSITTTRAGRYFGIWEKNNWVGGWIGERTQIASLDKKVFVSAPASLKLTITTPRGGGATNYLYKKLCNLKPSTRYRISYYVKLENVVPTKRGGGAALNLWDDANRWFPNHNFLIGTTPWTWQSFEFTTGPKTGLQPKIIPYMRALLLNATGTAWFDDIRLEEL